MRALLVGIAVTFAVLSAGAGATPRSFELVFDGHHGAFPNGMPRHEGPFTASAPFCASGTVVDLVHEGASSATRLHTCGDGSGTITMRIFNYPDEHIPGGRGKWQIIEGTGSYATLRGNGTWSSVPGAETTFRSTLSGLVDFDVEAPTIAVTRAVAAKLRKPAHTYLLRLGFSTRDNVEGNAVSYFLMVSADGSVLAKKQGQTSSGTVSLSQRIRPAKGTRRIHIDITASDPLGQQRSVARIIRIRR